MAKAFQCDKCGKLYPDGPVALLSLRAPPDNFYMQNYRVDAWVDRELCADCFHKLTGTKP